MVRWLGTSRGAGAQVGYRAPAFEKVNCNEHSIIALGDGHVGYRDNGTDV
jgi:hypothetical protein